MKIRELLAGSPFEQDFGEEVKITPENLLSAGKRGLDLDYIARNCLPPPFWERYRAGMASMCEHFHASEAHLIAQLIAEKEVDNA